MPGALKGKQSSQSRRASVPPNSPAGSWFNVGVGRSSDRTHNKYFLSSETNNVPRKRERSIRAHWHPSDDETNNRWLIDTAIHAVSISSRRRKPQLARWHNAEYSQRNSIKLEGNHIIIKTSVAVEKMTRLQSGDWKKFSPTLITELCVI